jgi:L-ascorbate metabolism protein UlaG (beta-lactamase superfamily)
MYPEESVQAAIDMKAKTAIPIHWGAFTLALHDWKNPVQRFAGEAQSRNQNIYMPKLGVPVAFADEQGETYWWENYE